MKAVGNNDNILIKKAFCKIHKVLEKDKDNNMPILQCVIQIDVLEMEE